jgi:hypothetical protein
LEPEELTFGSMANQRDVLEKNPGNHGKIHGKFMATLLEIMGKSDIGNILERSGIWDSQTIESF